MRSNALDKQPSLNDAEASGDMTAQELDVIRHWGWSTPTPIAKQAVRTLHRIREMRSGEFMVASGFLTEEELSKALSEKPPGIKTLEYLLQREPKAVKVADAYMAAKVNIPKYDLEDLTPIRELSPEVIAELDRFDALLAYLERDTGLVLLFSSYTQLSNFRSLGRDARMTSPIYREVVGAGDLHIALSDPQAIGLVLRDLSKPDTERSNEGHANLWMVSKVSAYVSHSERELSRLMDHCLAEDINDISLVPMNNGGFRIGVRRDRDIVSLDNMQTYSPEIAADIRRFLLSKSGANPSHSTRIAHPLDGSFSYASSAGSSFVRCSFIPTNHRGDTHNSTSISLRLLQESNTTITLEKLGVPEQVMKDLSLALRLTSGLVVVVGPTNSGKSTTIAGAINRHIEYYGQTRKRLSLEDPIERFMEGVIQFEPPGGAGEDGQFDRMLRAFKRHDPDLMWVGEVRDGETAEVCVDSSASGHLVLSTLHATDTVTAVDLLGRLVPSSKTFQLIESISLVLSQRLIKTVCPHCSSASPATEEEEWLFANYLSRLGAKDIPLPDTVARANPEGCGHCRNGFNGQFPIFESLPMTREARNAALSMVINNQARHDEVAGYRSLPLIDSAMGMVRDHKAELMSILT